MLKAKKAITFRHPLIADERIDARTGKRSGKGHVISRGLAGAADPARAETDLRRLLDDAPADWREAVEKVPGVCRDAFRLYFEPIEGHSWESDWAHYSKDKGSGKVEDFRRRFATLQRRLASLENELLKRFRELERLEGELLYKGAKTFRERLSVMRLGDLPKGLVREVVALHRSMACIGSALKEIEDRREGREYGP